MQHPADPVQTLRMVADGLAYTLLFREACQNQRNVRVFLSIIVDRVRFGELIQIQKDAVQVFLHSVFKGTHAMGIAAASSGPSVHSSPGTTSSAQIA